MTMTNAELLDQKLFHPQGDRSSRPSTLMTNDQKLFSPQGDRSSRPSTAAPSREISVQNLSNQGLGSPTKVSRKISGLENEQRKSNPSLEEVCVSSVFREGNLGCLSHFGQGRPDHDPSKWPPTNLDKKLSPGSRNFGGIPWK